MKGRFVKKCKCEAEAKAVLVEIPMTYGFQTGYHIECSECGKKFKEIAGKGPLVTNIKTEAELEAIRKADEKAKAEKIKAEKERKKEKDKNISDGGSVEIVNLGKPENNKRTLTVPPLPDGPLNGGDFPDEIDPGSPEGDRSAVNPIPEKKMNFAEKMKIAKAKKKAERDAIVAEEAKKLTGVVFDKDRD